MQQSSELLNEQLTLLLGLLLEQLYTQQSGQGRPQTPTVHFQFTPGTVLLGTAGMFLNLLTSPFVRSQPLWQDHFHVSHSEAQPVGPDFSSPAPPKLSQQANITSASFVTPGNQSTSGQLHAPIAPEYRDIGALQYQHL